MIFPPPASPCGWEPHVGSPGPTKEMGSISKGRQPTQHPGHVPGLHSEHSQGRSSPWSAEQKTRKLLLPSEGSREPFRSRKEQGVPLMFLQVPEFWHHRLCLPDSSSPVAVGVKGGRITPSITPAVASAQLPQDEPWT